jgi:hypothetical protein
MTHPRIDTRAPEHRLAPFRGVPRWAEKNPLNLIRVMPAKGQGLKDKFPLAGGCKNLGVRSPRRRQP